MSKKYFVILLVLVHHVHKSFENPFYWPSICSNNVLLGNRAEEDCCRCCYHQRSHFHWQYPVFSLIAAPNRKPSSTTIMPSTTIASTTSSTTPSATTMPPLIPPAN